MNIYCRSNLFCCGEYPEYFKNDAKANLFGEYFDTFLADKETAISSIYTLKYVGTYDIDSLDSAEQIAHSIAQNDLINIVFESSVIKNRFFSELKRMRPDATIICCTSTLQRFKRNVEESSDLIIYNNINKCENSDILDIIKENKGVFVC